MTRQVILRLPMMADKTLETDQFLQLRSPDINEEYVTDPFTVYLYDKKSKNKADFCCYARCAHDGGWPMRISLD